MEVYAINKSGGKCTANVLTDPSDPTEDRTTTPSRSGNKTCFIFAWVGQPYSSCDTCGKPFWGHLYRYKFGGEAAPLRVKRYLGYKKTWVLEPVIPIDPEERAAVQRKWG